MPTGFTRISTVAGPSGSSAPIAAAAISLAASLASAGTASSRSTTATSGARRGIFAIMPAWLAGMNNMLRTRVSSVIRRPVPDGPGLDGPGLDGPGLDGRGRPWSGRPWSGRHSIIAARTATQTVSSRWLRPWCSNVTMPASGRDRDRRASRTSVTTWMVSPANTGAGKSTREKPRLATVVPRVSSGTASPTTRPSVNRLFTRGRPNSVLAANSASRWSGCGFMVMVVNSTLSVSVTVRVTACSTRRPGSSCSNHSPATGHAPGEVSAATACCTARRPAVSSMALVSPCGPPCSTTSRSRRRMVLPVLVLGSAPVR